MKKNFLMVMTTLIVLIVVTMMGIVYAALSQNLKVSGTATLKNASDSWNVHFNTTDSKLTPIVTEYAKGSEASVTGTIITGINVELFAPNDSVTYTFSIENSGSITAKLDSIVNVTNGIVSKTCSGTTTSIADAYCDYVSVKLYKGETGTTLATTGDILTAKTGKQTYRLVISLEKNLDSIPNEQVAINIGTIAFNYAQN